jgi:hypothetical protein
MRLSDRAGIMVALMARAGRYMLGVVAALWLLLWLATVTLWVRSYWRRDLWLSKHDYQQGSISSNRGEFTYQGVGFPYPMRTGVRGFFSTPAQPIALVAREHPDSDCQFRFLGIGVYRGDAREGMWFAGEPPFPYTAVAVPHWLVALVLAIPPALGLMLYRRFRQRRRALAAGLCPRCGYDLRATPQQCPECGWGRTRGSMRSRSSSPSHQT